jgi:hypothetical protein
LQVANAVELDTKNRDPKYVATIVERTKKIVDKLELKDSTVYKNVLNIVANKYFSLNDIYEKRDTALARVKRSEKSKEERAAAQSAVQHLKDAELYRSHFAFPADLSLYLNESQIDVIKDGITFGVLMVTYNSTLDMIPTLTDEEKKQIFAWLKEAREYAIDAESSNKKHEVFGKYKGRINNYLSKRGYNLTKEREEWYKRIKAREEAEKNRQGK